MRAPVVATLFAALAICALAGCAEQGSNPPATLPPMLVPGPTKATNVADWVNAPRRPPPTCPVAPVREVRHDVAPMVSLGPIHATLQGESVVDLPIIIVKTLWVVDGHAGGEVRITGRHRASSEPLLFYYECWSVSEDSEELVLEGPFDRTLDAARGYVVPMRPGCYDLTARWDTGEATISIWFKAVDYLQLLSLPRGAPGPWSGAPASPAPSCIPSVAETESPDWVGRLLSTGPVHWYVGEDGRLLVVPPVFGALTWWYVDEEAGDTVVLSARRRSDGAPLLFYDPLFVGTEQPGTTQRVVKGPFQTGEFHAFGVLIPPGPGCYDVTVDWEGGQATATLGFF